MEILKEGHLFYNLMSHLVVNSSIGEVCGGEPAVGDRLCPLVNFF